jgi:hypothetical protein
MQWWWRSFRHGAGDSLITITAIPQSLFVVMRWLSFLVLLGGSVQLQAQSENQRFKDSIRDIEYQLEGLSHRIINGADENERITSCYYFIQTLKKALQVPGSFDYPFNLIKTVSIIKPPNKDFRLFTWNLLLDSGQYRYFGAIQRGDGAELELFGLYDSAQLYEEPQKEVLDARHWYGALYYQIKHYKYKKQDYYILMGWDGEDATCNRKVLDILYFNDEGEPVFGHPVFEVDKDVFTRVVFTFSNEATMLLRYEEKDDMIVFANLVPPNPLMKGEYEHYLPDGTYDYFKRKKDRWIRYQMLWGGVKNSQKYRRE